jgi:hypothetical protein
MRAKPFGVVSMIDQRGRDLFAGAGGTNVIPEGQANWGHAHD